MNISRRRLYTLTAMASGMILILVYTVSFSCCVLAHSGLVGRLDPDEAVYQRDIEAMVADQDQDQKQLLYPASDLAENYADEDYQPGGSQPPQNAHRHNKKGRNSASGASQKRLPDAIIIGVKKGGTRALLEFLRIHPDIRAPGPEPHFFDRNYHLGLDWYRSVSSLGSYVIYYYVVLLLFVVISFTFRSEQTQKSISGSLQFAVQYSLI